MGSLEEFRFHRLDYCQIAFLVDRLHRGAPLRSILRLLQADVARMGHHVRRD